MDLFIHKEYSQLNYHIKYNPENNKLKFVNDNELTGDFIIGNEDFANIAKIFGINLPDFPPEKYVKSYKPIVSFTKKIPWKYCIPQKTYMEILKTTAESVYPKLKFISTDYSDYYHAGQKIITALKPAMIDKDLYQSFKDKPNAKSFEPDANGFAEVPTFDRTEAVTGRTKTVTGANLLLLKKEFRTMIKSRFGDDGEVIALDFKSLEPRLLLAITRPDFEAPVDIYESIRTELNLSQYTRQNIKEVVISELYGAGMNVLREKLKNLMDREILFLIETIGKYFKAEELKKKLIQQSESNNSCITNVYGRPVSTKNMGNYAIMNRFIQSSAVDVALLGFSNLFSVLEDLGVQDKALPIFIVHDALYMDMHKSVRKQVETAARVASKNIQKFEGKNFFITIKDLLE